MDMALQHTLVIAGEMHSHEALKVEYCEAGACAIASTLELSTGAWRIQCFVAQIWPIRNCFVGAESISIFKKYSVWVKRLPELQVRLETYSDIKCRNKKVVGISIIYSRIAFWRSEVGACNVGPARIENANGKLYLPHLLQTFDLFCVCFVLA